MENRMHNYSLSKRHKSQEKKNVTYSLQRVEKERLQNINPKYGQRRINAAKVWERDRNTLFKEGHL